MVEISYTTDLFFPFSDMYHLADESLKVFPPFYPSRFVLKAKTFSR